MLGDRLPVEPLVVPAFVTHGGRCRCARECDCPVLWCHPRKNLYFPGPVSSLSEALPGRQAVAASGLGGVFCGPFRSQLPCGHSGGTTSPGSPVAEPPGKAKGVFVPVLFLTPVLGDRGEVAP